MEETSWSLVITGYYLLESLHARFKPKADFKMNKILKRKSAETNENDIWMTPLL